MIPDLRDHQSQIATTNTGTSNLKSETDFLCWNIFALDNSACLNLCSVAFIYSIHPTLQYTSIPACLHAIKNLTVAQRFFSSFPPV